LQASPSHFKFKSKGKGEKRHGHPGFTMPAKTSPFIFNAATHPKPGATSRTGTLKIEVEHASQKLFSFTGWEKQIAECSEHIND